MHLLQCSIVVEHCEQIAFLRSVVYHVASRDYNSTADSFSGLICSGGILLLRGLIEKERKKLLSLKPHKNKRDCYYFCKEFDQDYDYQNGFYNIFDIYYEYEYPYEHKTSSMQKNQYRPDFFLGEGKYLEHFGINKEGKTAPQINSYNYNQGIIWKRSLHRQKGTTLIETYSWERQEGIILKNLEKSTKNILGQKTF